MIEQKHFVPEDKFILEILLGTKKSCCKLVLISFSRHISQDQYNNNYLVTLAVYDYDVLTSNTAIATAEMRIQDLLSLCHTAKSPNSQALFEVVPLTLDLSPTLSSAKKEPSQLMLQVSFAPYRDVNRNFWLALSKEFDADNSGDLNKVEMVTMLDSIGCTLSDECLSLLFQKLDTDPNSTLSFEDFFESIERFLQSPKDVIGKGNENEHLIQVSNCPICKRKLKRSADIDIVSHVAVRQ
jgi:phosphatidylserine decarboxylase